MIFTKLKIRKKYRFTMDLFKTPNLIHFISFIWIFKFIIYNIPTQLNLTKTSRGLTSSPSI